MSRWRAITLVAACGCADRPLYLPNAAADLGSADLAPASFDLSPDILSPDAAAPDFANAPTDDLAPRPDMAPAATSDMGVMPICTTGLRLPGVPLVQPSYPVALVASADFDGDGILDLVAAGGSDLDVILGKGDGTFQPLVKYTRNVNSVTTDDFNGDGKPDLLIGYTTLIVALNQGDGTFDPNDFAWGKGIPAGAYVAQVTSGDFNHDGKRDIVAAAGGQVVVALGNGDGTFAPLVKYPTGSPLNSVLVGDLDGDGNADLVAVMQTTWNSSPDSSDLGVLLGKGDGTFGAVVRYGAPIGGGSGFGALGDINHDGKLDVLATGYNNNLVSVFLGNGDGTLQAPTSFAGNSVAHTNFGSDFVAAIGLDDFNGDGNLDVVTTEPPPGSTDYDNFVNLSLGNGDGTFQPALRVITSSRPLAFTFGDFDRDGKLDVATSGYDVGVVLGQGDGTFAGPDRYSVANSPYALTTGDFNGDGNLDVAVSSFEAGGKSTIHTLLGSGDGHFTAGGASSTVPWTALMATADLDGDGKLDLVVLDGLPAAPDNTVYVLFGKGDGSFGAPIAYAVGEHPVQLALADLDGNGTLDIVTADQGSSTVSVLLGRGKGAFAAAVQYAAGVEAEGVTIGDFNHDGTLDLAVSGFNGGAQTYTLALLSGNGDGTFARGVFAGYAAGAIVSADFNGDGNLDIAGRYSGFDYHPSAAVGILLGKGDGTFSTSVAIDGDVQGVLYAVGDINGDAHPDLITFSNGGDDVAVFLGKGDGTFWPGSDYAGGWRPSQVATGDFNHDGKLDVVTISSGEASNDGEVNILLNRDCH